MSACCARCRDDQVPCKQCWGQLLLSCAGADTATASVQARTAVSGAGAPVWAVMRRLGLCTAQAVRAILREVPLWALTALQAVLSCLAFAWTSHVVDSSTMTTAEQPQPCTSKQSAAWLGLHAVLGAVAGPMCYAGGAQAPAYPLRLACSSGRLMPPVQQLQPLPLPEGSLLTSIERLKSSRQAGACAP